MRRRLQLAALGAGAAAVAAMGVTPALADTSSGPGIATFTAIAQAPMFQASEDEPGANFHPEGEGELVHTLATLDNTSGYALAAPVWPGPAAANPGALANILVGGLPPQTQGVGDPVRAEATSAGPQTSSLDTPADTMEAAANASSARSDLTVATSGDPAVLAFEAAGSHSKIVSDSNSVTSQASSNAHNVVIAGGVVKIGNVNSWAKASTADKNPSGATTFTDLTIAGQKAWVDGTGIHVGSPGSAPNPFTTDQINQGLAQAGMEIFFVHPRTITVGQKKVFYAGALVFYWFPPQNSHDNSFTLTVGGAAVAVGSSNGTNGLVLSVGGTSPSLPLGSTGGPVGSAVPAGSDVPTSAAVALGAPTSPSRPLAQSATAVPSGLELPGGIGLGWVALMVLASAFGAVALPRLPALLSAASGPACEREEARGES